MAESLARRATDRLHQNVAQGSASRNVLSQPDGDRALTPAQQAAVVFDMACIRMWGPGCGKQVALALGIGEPLVSKWRSPDHRELPSIGQLTALGPAFLRLWHREQSKFYGLGRLALLDVLGALEDLAEEMTA